MTDELKPSPEAVELWGNANEAAALVIDRALRHAPMPEQAVMVCPQCEGEGGYPDGVDEGACHTDCTRCGGNGWIVDLAALRPVEIDPTYPGRYLTPGMGEALDALTRPAAMPGDVVEAVERAIQDQANPGFGVSDQSKRQATAAITAMQPALQAAVEALEAELLMLERAIAEEDPKGELLVRVLDARQSLATLRGATEQGEPTHD